MPSLTLDAQLMKLSFRPLYAVNMMAGQAHFDGENIPLRPQRVMTTEILLTTLELGA